MTIKEATDILMMSEPFRRRKGYDEMDVEEARNIVAKAHNTRLWLKDIKKYLGEINNES